MRLGIEINRDRPFFPVRQGGRQIQGGGGFTHPAFLVEDRYHSHVLVSTIPL
jgi:hypothetical protein